MRISFSSLSSLSSFFPPQARQLANVLVAHGSPTSVDQAFLLGSPLNFFYLRGPHLSPPHQIAGLSPTLVLAGLRRVGFQTAPLAPEALPVVLAQPQALGHAPWPIAPEQIGQAADAPLWLVATEPEPVARTGEPVTDPARCGWQVLVPPAAPVAREEALAGALADTAYAMMVCSGAWQGVDGIEYFSEDLVRWEPAPAWPESAAAAAAVIAATDGLWRRAFATALRNYDPTAAGAEQWQALADEWCLFGEGLAEAAQTGAAARLAGLSRGLLRLAHQESRAWAWLIDTFGGGI